MTIRAPLFSGKRPRKVQQPQIVQNLLVTTLVVTAPFFQLDWPNPQALEIQQPEIPPVSIALTAPPAPFSQIDWPNPQRLILPQQPIPKSMAIVDEGAVVDPFRQTDWPTTVLAHVQVPFQVGSPYALIGEKPFHQDDWVTPPAIATIQLEQAGKSIALVEAAVEDPFFQLDWPNPTIPLAIQLPQVGIPLTLVGFVDGPIFRIWANPSEELLVQQPFQVGSSLTLLEDEGEKPFHQDDWITPPRLPTQTPFQIGSSVALLNAVLPPFFQFDWITPVPLPTQMPVQLGMPLSILEDAGEKPFSQTEWQNPTLEITPQAVQLSASTALLSTPVQDPFAQHDWQNPTIRVLVQTPFQVGVSLTILVDAGDKPFTQTDWPNPTLRVLVQTPFQVGSSYALIGEAGEKPFHQDDWITPPARPTQMPVQIPAHFDIPPAPVITSPGKRKEPGGALVDGAVTISPAQLARQEKRERLLQEDEELLVLIHVVATILSEPDEPHDA